MKPLQWMKVQWDRVVAGVCALLGLACLLAGYLAVRDETEVAEQIPYVIIGGLLGIFLLGVGATFWLSADLRDEWRELRRLRRAASEERGREASVLPAADRSGRAASAAVTVGSSGR